MRIRIRHICALLLSGVLFSSPASAEFVGDLVLLPNGCEATGHCTLANEFGFIDSNGVGWTARKGLSTDGATIPPWAQPFVGQPFEKAFIKAAVIHDHYCDRRVRPWRTTHRVFYDALRQSGVSKGRAGIMYFAVMVGGPKWSKLIPGKPCAIGLTCINQIETGASVPGAGITFGEDGAAYLARSDTFGSKFFAVTMDDNLAALEAKGDSLEPSEVEAEAAKAMGADFFYINGDEVESSLRRLPQIVTE